MWLCVDGFVRPQHNPRALRTGRSKHHVYPLIKPRAHLPEILREFAYHRHADRPTELHRFEIGANREFVCSGQRPQPLPNRFGPRFGAEENNISKTRAVNLRVREEIRDLIDQAAKIQGRSRSDFMIDAARRAASRTYVVSAAAAVAGYYGLASGALALREVRAASGATCPTLPPWRRRSVLAGKRLGVASLRDAVE
jgi:hypothetical protein